MNRLSVWQWVAGTLPSALLLFSGSAVGYGSDTPENPQVSTAATSGLYVKVQLEKPMKLSNLKAGDKIEGNLARDVYSEDRQLFSAGDRVELTVDHLEKRRRIPNDHWPWVVKAFTPRHEKYPVFKMATVFVLSEAASNGVSAGGGSKVGENSETTLQVSLISLNRTREVHAQAKKTKWGQQRSQESGSVQAEKPSETVGSGKQASRKPSRVPTMVLEGFGTGILEKSGGASAAEARAAPSDQTLPAGTACKILLLTNLSASKSKPGDVVRARLLEPVRLNSRVVLPAGSLFDGTVVKKTPPKWLSRAGSISLSFTELTLPDGNHVPVAASLAGAELDRASHTRIDAEGQLHGERPGKAWMAITVGVTAGISKEVDDGTQLILEAIISTATDASTAGGARIAGSCISAAFMVSRHGRDVVLPRFTEMDISLDRPLSLMKSASSGAQDTAAHGN